MDKFLKTILLFSCILFSVFTSSSAQSCSAYSFGNKNNLFSTCSNLPVQNAFLHWTYHQTNHTVDIAYRHREVTSSQWVAWALNIVGSGMVGSQSLVAFVNSSGGVRAYTSPISSKNTQLKEGRLSFNVPKINAEFLSNTNEMIIFATLELPKGRTEFTQVWQVGPVSGDAPGMHKLDPDNRNSVGRVDFISGKTSSGGGVGSSKQRRRNVHGVLNTVSWGILLPLGALTARYLKVFKSADPAWFFLHAACQSSAYIVGVAGWGTGLKLGSDSPGIQYDKHRNIGITLFCLGTLQVHGVLNTVSWGILLPLGALTARYLKVFKSADPAWFFLHAACQSSAYIVGVAGWGTGLKLGSDSPGIQYDKHRNIGITLFCLGTLQVFALLLRPTKDHKYRLYWNIYHHAIGYTVIILSIVNIFEGFDILDPEKKWKRAYIGVLIFLGAVAAILEAFTWYIVLKRKRDGSDKHPHAANRVNGANGVNRYKSQQEA